MTQEEYKKIHQRIVSGLDMVSEKAEKIGREKSEWSLCEVGEVADIVKDIAKSFKCLLKAEMYVSDGSVEKY